MKTLKMFGMTLVATVMGVSLASCSKDENPTGDKKLTKLVAVTPSGNEVGWIFTYDDNGKLNKAQFNYEWDSQKYSTAYLFSWNGNTVDAKMADGSDDAKYTFTQENGLISSARKTHDSYPENYSYTYFADRLERIDKRRGKAKNYTAALWDGDKLVKISNSNSGSSTADEIITITYGESCKKGYCPLVPQMIDESSLYTSLYMAHPELIGARTTQLPANSSIVYNSEYGVNPSSSDTYDYELDNSGYISKIHIDGYYVNHYEEEERSNYSYTFTLTWE